MALFYLVFAGLFGWSAYLQLNDPDTTRWVVMYVYLTVLSLAAVFRQFSKLAIVLGLAGCAYLAYHAYPGFVEFLQSDTPLTDTMSDEHPYIEEFREFGGLAISAFVLVVMLFSSFRGKKKKAKSS